MTTNWVDADAFRESMAPVVKAMLDFATAIREVGPRHGDIADAESPAMRELSTQAEWKQRSGWIEPFGDTHSMGGLTMGAASDYVKSFAQLFDGDHAPVYGHLVLARAGLEAAVVSWWLSEPGISRESRAKRGLSEYLYSAWEERRLGLDPKAREHLTKLRGFAKGLGWPVVNREGDEWSWRGRSKPFVDGVGRPSIPDGIARLLTDDTTAQLGRVQWSQLSAVTHTTFWGVSRAFLTEDAKDSPVAGHRAVPVGTHAGRVFLQVICLLRSVRVAANARCEFMGWNDEERRSAASTAERHERHLLEAVKPYLAKLPT